MSMHKLSPDMVSVYQACEAREPAHVAAALAALDYHSDDPSLERFRSLELQLRLVDFFGRERRRIQGLYDTRPEQLMRGDEDLVVADLSGYVDQIYDFLGGLDERFTVACEGVADKDFGPKATVDYLGSKEFAAGTIDLILAEEYYDIPFLVSASGSVHDSVQEYITDAADGMNLFPESFKDELSLLEKGQQLRVLVEQRFANALATCNMPVESWLPGIVSTNESVEADSGN